MLNRGDEPAGKNENTDEWDVEQRECQRIAALENPLEREAEIKKLAKRFKIPLAELRWRIRESFKKEQERRGNPEEIYSRLEAECQRIASLENSLDCEREIENLSQELEPNSKTECKRLQGKIKRRVKEIIRNQEKGKKEKAKEAKHAKEAEEAAREAEEALAGKMCFEAEQAASNKTWRPVPKPDDEAGPVMEDWDDILCNVKEQEPPIRDAESWPIAVQYREPSGLHELMRSGVNQEEQETSRLPPPKQHLLTRHNKYSLEIEIGRYITFYKKVVNFRRHVAPPDRMIEHCLRYSVSKIPRVHAVLTMPLVLPSGELLATNGLDRKRKFIMRTDPEVLEFIPQQEECTPQAVKEAFQFLVDEWLVDVATDFEGKCVLIALALTIIERILFPERPVFAVTAGMRGGGKTTATNMVILAATGIRPPASAWSMEVEERRKSVFSALREGIPALVWDNIPRGTEISCPVIEGTSTSETASDRILGKSERESPAAYMINTFTGNNITFKGDLASRALMARLNTDTPNPENRNFKHSDPMGWTIDHRGQILHALYTILLGNPQLDINKSQTNIPTRFKSWWNLVGGAVEYAAKLYNQDEKVQFVKLFEKSEEENEEASETSAILRSLFKLYALKEFKAAEILTRIKLNESDYSMDASDEIIRLREFFVPKTSVCISAKTIGKSLKAIKNVPVEVQEPIGNPPTKTRKYILQLKSRTEHSTVIYRIVRVDDGKIHDSRMDTPGWSQDSRKREDVPGKKLWETDDPPF